MLLKDAIKRSPTSFITSKTVQDWQKYLGLTIPVVRFLRRYPTLFHEFPHSRFSSLHCFKLTDLALALDQHEQLIYEKDEFFIVEKLCKILMMMKSRTVPLQSIYPLNCDMGFPDFFEKSIVSKCQNCICLVKGVNGLPSLRLVQWRDEFTVSALQKSCNYWGFQEGGKLFGFPYEFSRGLWVSKES